ncbi:hypothetical protein [Thermocrinis jamiesonii]|uniref:hypothetical protein n=1 Tax=Thermocrinis jamiesonii TaxID=1302351 RepID=UPI0012DC2649
MDTFICRIEAGTLAMAGFITGGDIVLEGVFPHIIDGRLPHSILLEVFTDEGIGTQIVL